MEREQTLGKMAYLGKDGLVTYQQWNWDKLTHLFVNIDLLNIQTSSLLELIVEIKWKAPSIIPGMQILGHHHHLHPIHFGVSFTLSMNKILC